MANIVEQGKSLYRIWTAGPVDMGKNNPNFTEAVNEAAKKLIDLIETPSVYLFGDYDRLRILEIAGSELLAISTHRDRARHENTDTLHSTAPAARLIGAHPGNTKGIMRKAIASGLVTAAYDFGQVQAIVRSFDEGNIYRPSGFFVAVYTNKWTPDTRGLYLGVNAKGREILGL